MPFTLCTHLVGAKRCGETTSPGDKVVCVCTNDAKDRVWPRIRNVHDATHGRLVLSSTTPPSGVLAVYELQHDTATSTQTGFIDGPPVPWGGGMVNLLIKHSIDGIEDHYELQMEQPEGC